MRFSVADDVLALFPVLTIGLLEGTIDSMRPGWEATVGALQGAALDRLRASCPDVESLPAQPSIEAWRQAYQRFGVKPSRFRPTHEALARRLLKAPEWPAINPLVDLYLTNQVAHLLPHGGYDRDALHGDLRLDRSPGGEPFVPLGGDPAAGEEPAERTEPGEIVYRDGDRVLTRRFNHRDCAATRITGETRRFLLFIEGVGDIPAAAVDEAVGDLTRRVDTCCAGSFEAHLFTVKAGDQAITLR